VLALRVTFRAAEPQRVPPFLGSALHGALGRALYRTVCAFPKHERCNDCPLARRCPYPALFETPAGINETLCTAGIRDQAPRPLVLAPEPGWTRPSGKPVCITAGAEIPCRLTLIGGAIDDLPVVTVALQAAARRGLAIPAETADVPGLLTSLRRRAALQLAAVCTADGSHVVYDAEGDEYTPPDRPTVDLDHGGRADTVEISLVSPLRIKHEGRLATTITPALFFDTLARRANALSVLYGSGQPAVDVADATSRAARLSAEEAILRLVHVRRYSARQGQRMSWPGLMGQLRWRGATLADLWPLLRFGELVQVGKGTALGFGRYRIDEPRDGEDR
jgi:CRISPR-associated endoribonuclease Cas6